MDNNAYIHILIQSLSKKNSYLDRLIEITMLQEEYITAEPLDEERFEQTLSEKELIIDQLRLLDEGFEKVYDHVKDVLNSSKMQLKQEILQIKELIRQITEKSVGLQALEMKNKKKLEVYFSTKKKEIKEIKKNNQTASRYYKNSVNQYIDQSYFIDKKK